ncbi:MAG: DUF3868 domain-containing protein, partial [Bacteroidales bacterium]
MRNLIRYILLSLFSGLYLQPLFPASGQADLIRTAITRLVKVNDSVFVSYRIDIDKKGLSSQKELIVRPVLLSEENTLPLAVISVKGKSNYNNYKRSLLFQPKATAENPQEVYRYGKSSKSYTYRIDTSFLYEDWMKNASLDLYMDVCGCGRAYESVYDSGKLKYHYQDRISNPALPFIRLFPKDSDRSVKLAYVLHFEVNKDEINKDIESNQENLNQLAFDLQKLNRNYLQIDQIELTGFASPEGPYERNRYLANRRSEAFLHYAQTLMPALTKQSVSFNYVDEDWEGLNSILRSDTSRFSKAARDILSSDITPEERKQQLKRINGGQFYAHLKKHYLTKLRKAELSFCYQIDEKAFADSGITEPEYTEML